MVKHSIKHIKVYSIVLSIVFLLLLLAFIFLFHHAGYDTKVLAKFGYMSAEVPKNYAILAWDNCLQQLGYDADIVFLGDSITKGCNFKKYFDKVKIVNLGYAGDTLAGITDRISMVTAVSPEKVFLMGGINGLTDHNIDNCVELYATLLDKLNTAMPETEVFVLSVLPVSAEKEISLLCHNTSIEQFNRKIKELATERDYVYVDLYSQYSLNGKLNPALTKDGVHLCSDAYDLWANAIKPYID